MHEPTGCAGNCPRTDVYCDGCDLLVGLPGLRVFAVVADRDRLTVSVESPPAEQGCRTCGVIADSHGRRKVRLVNAPSFGRPVQIVWRKRLRMLLIGGGLTSAHPQVRRAPLARVGTVVALSGTGRC